MNIGENIYTLENWLQFTIIKYYESYHQMYSGEMTLSASYCKNYIDKAIKTKNLLAKVFCHTVTSYVAYPIEMGSIKPIHG